MKQENGLKQREKKDGMGAQAAGKRANGGKGKRRVKYVPVLRLAEKKIKKRKRKKKLN